MAQVFPLNVDDLSPDEGRASLAGTLAALPDPWTLLRHRRIGDEEAEPEAPRARRGAQTRNAAPRHSRSARFPALECWRCAAPLT